MNITRRAFNKLLAALPLAGLAAQATAKPTSTKPAISEATSLWYKPEGCSEYCSLGDVVMAARQAAPIHRDVMLFELPIPEPTIAPLVLELQFDGARPSHQGLVMLEASGMKADYILELPEKGYSTVTRFEFSGFIGMMDIQTASRAHAVLEIEIQHSCVTMQYQAQPIIA